MSFAGPGFRPIALPHLEADEGGPVRFLGEELAPDVLTRRHLDLWRRCDGGRAIDDFAEEEQAAVRRWHAAGMMVMAPPPGGRVNHAVAVISPHPDDATLALGASLASVGGVVLDVFSTETWTRRPYYVVRPQATSELLLAEERVACTVLGCVPEFLGELDGAARPAWGDGYMVEAAAGEEVTGVEPALLQRLVERLGDALAGASCVLAPLALGGHVDHVFCREAAIALAASGRVPADRLGFYEDMPYGLFGDPRPLVAELAVRPGMTALRHMELHHDERAAMAKAEALRAYRLQVPQGIVDRVVRRGRSLARQGAAHSERIWSVSPLSGLESISRLL